MQSRRGNGAKRPEARVHNVFSRRPHASERTSVCSRDQSAICCRAEQMSRLFLVSHQSFQNFFVFVVLHFIGFRANTRTQRASISNRRGCSFVWYFGFHTRPHIHDKIQNNNNSAFVASAVVFESQSMGCGCGCCCYLSISIVSHILSFVASLHLPHSTRTFARSRAYTRSSPFSVLTRVTRRERTNKKKWEKACGEEMMEFKELLTPQCRSRGKDEKIIK